MPSHFGEEQQRPPRQTESRASLGFARYLPAELVARKRSCRTVLPNSEQLEPPLQRSPTIFSPRPAHRERAGYPLAGGGEGSLRRPRTGNSDFWITKQNRERPWTAPEPVGERGFEPPTSASRTLRANRTALLPGAIEDTTGHPGEQSRCARWSRRPTDCTRYRQVACGSCWQLLRSDYVRT